MFKKLSIYPMAIYYFGGRLCFGIFINNTLNAMYYLFVDQEQYYFGHKQKHRYKYLTIIILDRLISSFIGLFISRQGDWKMVEYLSLMEKLRAVNDVQKLT